MSPKREQGKKFAFRAKAVRVSGRSDVLFWGAGKMDGLYSRSVSPHAESLFCQHERRRADASAEQCKLVFETAKSCTIISMFA